MFPAQPLLFFFAQLMGTEDLAVTSKASPLTPPHPDPFCNSYILSIYPLKGATFEVILLTDQGKARGCSINSLVIH